MKVGIVICQKMAHCHLQVGNKFLPPLKGCNYLGVVFMTEGKIQSEIDRLYQSVILSHGQGKGRNLRHEGQCLFALKGTS